MPRFVDTANARVGPERAAWCTCSAQQVYCCILLQPFPLTRVAHRSNPSFWIGRHLMWKPLLYQRFRDQPYPLVVFDHATLPAASLWVSTRHWIDVFRRHELDAGDRLVLALPPSPGFLAVTMAALWEGLTLALAAPSTDLSALVVELDARVGVGPHDPGPGRWTATPVGLPIVSSSRTLRTATAPPSPDVRFLLRTSGTTGPGRWIGLSDANVHAVLESHGPALAQAGARVLSVLPWHHAFGFVLDLWPTLLAGATLIREPSGGRRPDSMLRYWRAFEATHLSAVPLTLERLAGSEDGRRCLRRLDGGLVGGAPVTGPLADTLATTSLRVGYGQTEAAPGILLGAPGYFPPRYIGQPVGCDVRLSGRGTLQFRGPNAYCARWHDGQMSYAEPDRWVDTGDRVRHTDDGYVFEGRADTMFKLANGRSVTASVWESRLQTELASVERVLVFPTSTARLAVALWMHPTAPEPTAETVAASFGDLARWLEAIHTPPAFTYHRTPKGDMDRTATREAVRRYLHHQPIPSSSL